jgi:hypothetical protein
MVIPSGSLNEDENIPKHSGGAVEPWDIPGIIGGIVIILVFAWLIVCY